MPEIFSSASRKKSSQPAPEHVVEEPTAIEAAAPAMSNQVVTTNTAEETGDTPNSRAGRSVDEYSQVMSRLEPSHNPFNAFAPKPFRVTFDAQHDEEQVLLLLRQHPITQLPWIFIAVGLVFLPYLFSFVGVLDFLPLRYHLVATIGWYLMVLGYVLQSFLSWFYNVYIVTDERVVDVDFNNLLYKNVSYAKIDNIEDITATTAGSLGAIFDFGTVKIQTAATNAEFEFEDVPHPSRVTAFLNEMILEEEKEVRQGRAN